MSVSDYEPLKEFLDIPPRDLTYHEVVFIFWSALEAINRLEELVGEFEVYVDNERTCQEIRNRCMRRYYSTLRAMDS